ADAGYGSEENYSYLEQNDIGAFVKYGMFHRETRQESKKNRAYGLLENLYYDPEKDRYTCPMGQPMETSGESTKKTSTGFLQHFRHYRAKNCTGCPLAGSCKAGKSGKVLQVNRNLQEHKQKAKELLTSEEGIQKRKQRATDVEPVFGNLKFNKGK